MTKTTHYKIASIGLLAIFVAMVTPSSVYNISESTSEFAVYGMAELVQADGNGNEIFTQSIHNRLTDQGEDYIINQAFATDEDLIGAADRIGAICISSLDGAAVIAENATAEIMSGGSLGTSLHCIADDVADTPSTATLGPLLFTSGVNLASGDTIASIAICSSNGGSNYEDCQFAAENAIAFAVVDTTDLTLTGTDTVNITYTFDLVTDST